jgi:hypothetical protein
MSLSTEQAPAAGSATEAAVVQPTAHDCCESAPALAHFIKQLPHVGLEVITATTPAAAPPGLLDTPISSVIEHGAWPAKSKGVSKGLAAMAWMHHHDETHRTPPVLR